MSAQLPLPPAQPTKWATIFYILFFNMLLYSMLTSRLNDVITFATKKEMFLVGAAGLAFMVVSAFTRGVGEIALLGGLVRLTNALAAISWTTLAGAVAAFVGVTAILYLAASHGAG